MTTTDHLAPKGGKATFPPCTCKVIDGYRALSGQAVRAVTAPPDDSPLAVDAAWLWDAIDQGYVSARRVARDLGLLDGPWLDVCGEAFESIGLPRPALMEADDACPADDTGAVPVQP